MKLTTSLQPFSPSLVEQIKEALIYQMKEIILNVTAEDYDKADEVIMALKETKVSIAALDPHIQEVLLYEPRESWVSQYKEAIAFAAKIKCRAVMMRLPKFKEIVPQYSEIKESLIELHNQAQKMKVMLVITPNENETNVYSYILHQAYFKNFKFYFDAVILYQNKASLTTTYRLLKPYILFFKLADCNAKFEPVLINYGKTKIMDAVERLKRDAYDGYIVLDDQMVHVIGSENKKNIFQTIAYKWFGKGSLKDKLVEHISQIMYPKDSHIHEITQDDVMRHQIDFAKALFKPLL